MWLILEDASRRVQRGSPLKISNLSSKIKSTGPLLDSEVATVLLLIKPENSIQCPSQLNRLQLPESAQKLRRMKISKLTPSLCLEDSLRYFHCVFLPLLDGRILCKELETCSGLHPDVHLIALDHCFQWLNLEQLTGDICEIVFQSLQCCTGEDLVCIDQDTQQRNQARFTLYLNLINHMALLYDHHIDARIASLSHIVDRIDSLELHQRILRSFYIDLFSATIADIPISRCKSQYEDALFSIFQR